MKTADIGATYRANGMGEPCEDGSYIRVVVATKGTLAEELAGLTQAEYLISLGQAELLRDGLGALLPDVRPFRIVDARITHAIEEVGGEEDLFPGASIQDELDIPLGGLRADNSFIDIPARPSALLGDDL